MLQPNDEFLFTRQEHHADRMGLHYDLRLVHGDKAYSFATKKDMPKPGEIISVYEQPIHDRSYALSEKVVIPKGQYGAGVTYLNWVRKAKVASHSTPDKLVIFTKDGEKYLLKKSPTKENETSWIFRNITGMGKSENPYLKKAEDTGNKEVEKKAGQMNKYLEKIASCYSLEKDASFVTGALATHLLQNIGTSRALKSGRIAKYLADGFSEGAHGMVNTSVKSKLTRGALGAGLPDVAVAHKSLHDLGHKMKPLLDKATPKQKLGIRMITEGRFQDLAKHNLHNDPVVRDAHREISKHLPLPSLDNLVNNSKKIEHVWKDSNHPLLSNISKNISRGTAPHGANFKPGKLSSAPVISGALTSAVIDPAAGVINTTKSLLSNKAIQATKYGKKLTDTISHHLIHNPIRDGIESRGDFSKLKNKVSQYTVNPVSSNLKRTSAALTDALDI